MLIVCEGAETEPRYFEALRRTLGLAATVDVVIAGKTGYTDPAGLVGAAEELRGRRMREARRSNTLVEFEDVWVVFDTEHPSNGRGPSIVPAVVKALRCSRAGVAAVPLPGGGAVGDAHGAAGLGDGVDVEGDRLERQDAPGFRAG